MSPKTNPLARMITQSVKALVETDSFASWFKSQRPTDGDLIVINNSFIYRKPLIRTSKNPHYLCLKVKNEQPDVSRILVTTPGDFDSDFKLFSAKSRNLPEVKVLDEAVGAQMKQLGQLVFVLIGKLEDTPAEVDVNHASVKKLRFEPSQADIAVVEQEAASGIAVVVNRITDPESAWKTLEPKLKEEIGDDLSRVEGPFADAFEKLREEARLPLSLPAPGAQRTDSSLVARLKKSVSEQRELYESALREYAKGDDAADRHLREVMRIAYNFAEDAIKVLQLLVSIADLKAVLLWCTIKEHFDVAEAFRNLPWTKSRKKPSLERYQELISGARNRAFHNLLAFDRTIEANLQGVQVSARRLTLFPAHGRRKTTIPFDYEDREMVEILSDLTRAPEVSVPLDFWKKNAAVIESFERLLAATEDALWAINGTRDKT